MKTKTNLKTGYQCGGHGALTDNHNETLAGGLRVKTAVQAGSIQWSGSGGAGLRVRSALKGGLIIVV